MKTRSRAAGRAIMKPAVVCIGAVIGLSACAGHQISKSDITVADSVVTTEYSLDAGKKKPVQVFGEHDLIHVLLDLTWPGDTIDQRGHGLYTEIVRNGQVVLTTPKTIVKSVRKPWHVKSTYMAQKLGVGAYRARIYVDDSLIATESFWVAVDQTVSPQTACKLWAIDEKNARPVKRLAGPNYPSIAQESNVEGCAAVTFDVDNTGVPRHIALLKEYPAGWGFGASVERFIAQCHYNTKLAGSHQHWAVNFKLSP